MEFLSCSTLGSSRHKFPFTLVGRNLWNSNGQRAEIGNLKTNCHDSNFFNLLIEHRVTKQSNCSIVITKEGRESMSVLSFTFICLHCS